MPAPSGFVSWMGEALSTPEATGTGRPGRRRTACGFPAGHRPVASSGIGAPGCDAAAVGGAGVRAQLELERRCRTSTPRDTILLLQPERPAGRARVQRSAGEVLRVQICESGLQAGAGAVARRRSRRSLTASGALACSRVTVAGVGVVPGAFKAGTGELVAGCYVSVKARVTRQVAPPVTEGSGGYHYRPDRRPLPVEGYGYGILPQIEGEAHGVVAAVGRSIGTLPRFAGQADAAAGAAGSSTARLTVKAAALGNAVARGRGFRHDREIRGCRGRAA